MTFLGVALDDIEFLFSQASRFIQNASGNAYLSNIVQDGGPVQDVFFRPARFYPYDAGISAGVGGG